MSEETTPETTETPSDEGLQKFFSSADQKLDSWMACIRTFFKHGTTPRFFLELFEPAVGGLVMAVALGILDLITGASTKDGLRHELLDGAMEHAKPFAFFVGLLGLGASLMMSGGVLAGPLRSVVVAPLLRLAHHVSMLAFGVMLACAWEISSARDGAWFLVVYVSVILIVLGTYAYLANLLFAGSHLAGLEKYRSFRWMAFVLGLIACIVSASTLGNLTSKHGEGAHKAKAETNAPAQASSGASGAHP